MNAAQHCLYWGSCNQKALDNSAIFKKTNRIACKASMFKLNANIDFSDRNLVMAKPNKPE